MSSASEKLRALTLVSILILSVVVGAVALSGTAAAAANTSITPDDDDSGASGVTYTAEGNVEVGNQDTLQHVDVHLSPADVSNVGESDVSVFIDGTEYTDGLSQFSASGGTVEFKLANSRSISDGDPIKIVVADVTNPSDDFDANVTLHDTGDAKWQTFADTVSIDTPPAISYSALSFEDSRASGDDTTVDVGEALDVSAVVTNSGEQAGTYNASLKIDGVVVAWNNGTVAGNSQQTVTFTRSFDSTGTHNVGIKTLGPTEVTVTGPVRITDGSANPSSVEAGTTVTNQQVTVDIANVSQDGDTDWHSVEFPNALASGLSVNSVDANATSITSSPNLVDGFDADGIDDTVKFATSGDGGGDIDLRLTVDVDVSYPDTETTYGVDARVADSDGGTDTQSAVAVISTESTPTISSFDATNPAGRDLSVAFDADEQLADIAVDVTNSSGTTVATLTEADFSESESGGTWNYQATTTLAEDGDYDATLVTAADGAGNDGATGQTDTVTINTNSVTSASITPDDDNASASGVTYTADGNVELSNQDTLQHVDVHLSPADVSNVGEGDISVFIDGTEYTDGLSQFSASEGAVEFKLANSRSVSDGDPVTIVVAGVSNPSDDFNANVTLHDTGDAKWQTFTDTVSIDTPPAISYANLAFDDGSASDDDTTVDVGESLDISAVVSNSGEQEGAYNAPLKIDGTVVAWNNGTVAGNSQQTITFTRSFDSAGTYDVGIKMLGPTEVTVTEPVQIVDGLANPDTVPPGTTVDTQEITVELSGVSADGNTDTHYVEFPNDLASGLSVNSASVNGSASIAQSAELVDGFDGDGVDDTVRFQTDIDGGGVVALTTTVDVSVDYPDTEATYNIDARIEDSDSSTDTQSAVATIEAVQSSDPIVTNFAVDNPADRDLEIAFDVDEQLSGITVELTDDSGSTVATLTERDFTESESDGVWSYETTTAVDSDGEYTATLTEAADADGNDGSDSQSDSATVDVATLAIIGGSATPSEVLPGTTVDNQEISVDLSGVSADGNTDTHYVEFPNALADGLSVNSASVEGSASIAQSAELVDGVDGDGIADTVRFQTDADGGGTTSPTTTVDVSVDYPNVEWTYDIDARVEDSDGDTDTRSAAATIKASDFDHSDVPQLPRVGNVTAENPTGRAIAVAFNASGQLDTIEVMINDSSGQPVVTLNESAFTATVHGDVISYATTDTVESDGSYTVRLKQAAADDGSDVADGENETVTVSNPVAEIIGGSGSPAAVRAGETVNNQRVSIALSGVSADGDTDVHYVEFPNALARNLSVNSADANATSITSSAELVDGFDDDGVADTVRFATSAENAAATDLSLTVDVAIAPYPSGNGSYAIDARTVDSLTGPVTRSAVATIEANASVETATITNFELVAENRDVDAVVRVTHPVDTLSVGIDGLVGMSLDRSDFDRTQRDGEYVYTADVVEDVPGAYEASLQQANDDGTDLATGQSSVVDVPIPDRLTGFGATAVTPAEEQSTLTLNGSVDVESVTVDSQASGSGIVAVRTFADAPSAVEDLSRPVVTVVNVSRPDSVADEPVTLSIAVENSSFGANASALRMTRYDESSDKWVQLDTTVASSADGSVTLQASASETSMFAITEPADTDQQDDPQDDQQNDQQQAEQEPTIEDGSDGDDGSPGLLALLAVLFLLGIVGAGAVAGRRYYRD